MKKILIFFIFFSIIFSSLNNVSHSQELLQDQTEILKAKVLKIQKQEIKDILGTDVEAVHQTLLVKILEGDKKDREVVVENDYRQLEEGQKFFLYYSKDALDGREMFSVKDINRLSPLMWFVALFVLVIIIFSGKQGVRSLLALTGSFLIIIYILLPLLLKGYPPIITSIAIASLVLFVAIYFTHGFNKQSSVAFSGTVFAVIITGLLAYLGVEFASLSGFSSEEAVYLNFNTRGALDFGGLLLGGIMIGVLGVLDDIAVTQAAVVSEIFDSAPHLSRLEVYKKALRVGREHVGALVNTLALAYTGTALPLILLFSTSTSPFSTIINQEIFATEIIRTIVGSIGLVLTVPITTLLAVYFLKGYKGKHEHHGHSHGHVH